MNNTPLPRTLIILSLMVFGLVSVRPAYGHCDKLDGPVAIAAREALDTGEFNVIRIWVGEDQEAELQDAFHQAREVRDLSSDAQQLADRYFIETAVRLHRAAEGMPFTGVKPAGTPNPEDIRAGDQAIQSGEIDPVLELLQNQLSENVKKWYRQAMDAKQAKDQNIQAGREWVDAYVQYIVYVHQLSQRIQSPPAHGVGE